MLLIADGHRATMRFAPRRPTPKTQVGQMQPATNGRYRAIQAAATMRAMSWIFCVDFAFVIGTVAAISLRRRRLVGTISVLLFVWQMLLIFIEPGVMSRMAVDASTQQQRDQGFFGGIEALHGPMFDLFAGVGLSVLCWPMLLIGEIRQRVPRD